MAQITFKNHIFQYGNEIITSYFGRRMLNGKANTHTGLDMVSGSDRKGNIVIAYASRNYIGFS